MKVCKIVNNKVENIELADAVPNGYVLWEDGVEIGTECINGVFTLPKPTSKHTPTFAENKLAKIKQLQDKYQSEYDAYLAQYPKREVDSFPVKQSEAIAYNLDNTAPTPIIDAIVSKNGATKDAYVASILTKVTALAVQEGEMVAIRDSIKACTTQADLDAIVV